MGCFPHFAPFGSIRRAIRAAGRTLVVGGYRLLVAIGIASLVASTAGCYSYPARPVADVVPLAVVSVEITDSGRVALADQIGSEVKRINGQVVQHSDSAFRVMVSEVGFLNGLTNKWEGQEVILRPRDVKSLSQRTYSSQRTVLAAIAIAGLVALAIITKGFGVLSSGDPNPDKPGGEPPPTT